MNHQSIKPEIQNGLTRLFFKGERIALFIDGANLHGAAKGLGFDIDFKLLREAFAPCGKLIRAYYYTAILETGEYTAVRTLTDWLVYNGFALRTKPAREYINSLGSRTIKGNMDVEVAVDAMEVADRIEHAVLFSGDGDFRSLVEALQRRGVRVTVISTMRTSPPMIADDLRRQADQFVELDALRSLIARPPRRDD